jgi:uncharacterized membrane protein
MTVLAALDSGDFGWRLLYLGHLLNVIAGFGPTFVLPMFVRTAQTSQSPATLATVVQVAGRVVTPCIWLAGIFGFLLAMFGGYEMGDFWISAAMVLFLIGAALASFVQLPNARRIAALAGQPGNEEELGRRGKRAGAVGGILHLLFFLLLIDMIWKPVL